jgi:hypothetical protein
MRESGANGSGGGGDSEALWNSLSVFSLCQPAPMNHLRQTPFLHRCPWEVSKRRPRRPCGLHNLISRAQSFEGEKFWIRGIQDVSVLS